MATIDQINKTYARLEALVRADPSNTASYHQSMQQLVAERDRLAAQQSTDYDAWHKAHGTGIYAAGGSASGNGESAAAREQRESASAFLRNVLTSYGLGSLAGSVDSLVQQWGTNTDVIALKLKDTNEYKTRFKGLLGLQQKGNTDVRNEAEYLKLESSYRQVFREAGLTSFLGDAGSQTEYDKIADLVGKYSLSVNEVRDRVSDAQRVAANTPKEVRDAFREFYGVDTAQLVEYTLDPTGTAERINRQANAAIAAGMARQQGLNIGMGAGDSIANLYGDQDLNTAQMQGSITQAIGVRDATARLASIEGGTLSDDESLTATMDIDAQAKKKIAGLQSRERARFSGQSAFGTGSLSRTSGV